MTPREIVLGGFRIRCLEAGRFTIPRGSMYDPVVADNPVGAAGTLRPTFPNAVYVIPKGEWATAARPPARDRASYVAADFEPLASSGRLRLVEGDAGIAAGIEVLRTPGHTAHHQSVLLRSEGSALLFAGDLIPTAAHAGFAFVMSYDLDPRLLLKTKRAVVGRAVPEGWIVALAHEPGGPFGTIVQDGTRFAFRPLA
jgi:glyoxylase-like metal-dependent hydrolase (beta-lactamase superfamily II)